MSEDWSVPGWAGLGVLVLLAVTLVAVLLLARASRRSLARSDERARDARAEVEALRHRVETIERRVSARTRPPEPEHVITSLGEPGEPGEQGELGEQGAEVDGRAAEPPAALAGPLFADLVLREGVVQAAAVAAGVRRALAPEQRHRIRLEMRREVKRARKQRRAEVRAARREVAARQRAHQSAGTTDAHRRDETDRAA